jgi:hypothetical protein
MGTQAQINKLRRQAKREEESKRDAAAIYLEGTDRATRILAWIEANHQAPFAMTVQVASSGIIATDDDSFFTVAASPDEFASKKAFLDMVANATMSMGVLAVIDGASATLIQNGQGHVRAWILGNEGFPERLPVKPAVTAQLKADFGFLAPYEHVEALPMTDLPAVA